MAMSKFKALASKIKRGNKGMSQTEANAITASIGRKKLGQKKMTALSVAGRKKAATAKKR
jgi:hypothetical protein